MLTLMHDAPNDRNPRELERLTKVARLLDSIRGNSFVLLMVAPLLQPVFGSAALIGGAIVGVMVLALGRWYARVFAPRILDLALALRSAGTISSARLDQAVVLVNRITSDGPRRADDPAPVLNPHLR
ncbi:MAG TPA: hypothetical protein VK358_05235 [Longimicrobium sp.]|nr:hypothetical protein [Longimicrobium sp.]